LTTSVLPSEVQLCPAPQRDGTRRFYHPELDALRFGAFGLVFLHHAFPHDAAALVAMGVPHLPAVWLAGASVSGAFGVDLFFVLSSYLITELLLREKSQRGSVDLKSFYIRRILRIWPLYFCFLALAGLMTLFVPGQQIGWRCGVAFTLLAGNWWIVFQGFPSSVIFPLWSVSIEEQFYLSWPSLVRRASERTITLAACGMLAVATGTRIWLGLHHTWESKVWSNTFAQLDPIAAGILLAVLLHGSAPQLTRLTRVALALGGIACLALAGNYFIIKGDPLTTMRIAIGYPVMTLGAVCLLLSVLHEQAETRKKPALAWRALIYLGKISYGLYVFHILGLFLSDYVVHDQQSSFARYMLRVAVALTATLLLSAASFRWLESPFLRMKQRFTHVLSRPGG
jgi:peptidoglycan/LPS O-acetylase OafA/YrhL